MLQMEVFVGNIVTSVDASLGTDQWTVEREQSNLPQNRVPLIHFVQLMGQITGNSLKDISLIRTAQVIVPLVNER